MPAILAHWLIAQEVTLKYIKEEIKGNEYFKFSTGENDDKFTAIDTSRQYDNEISRIREEMKDTLFYQMLIEKKQDVEISRYVYLGSNGPDLPYFENIKGKSKWADYLHYNNSAEFLLKLICNAKKNIHDEKMQYRVFGYALGHATHIISDAIVHPYVNLIAGIYHYQIYEDIHRTSELHQDSWLAQKYFGRSFIDDGPSWTKYLPSAARFKNLFPYINTTFKEVYGESPGWRYLGGAYKFFYDRVVDIDYDTATFFVPREPNEALVKHAGLKGESDYINYTKLIIKKAVSEAFNACKNVINVFESICKANNNKEEEKVKNTFRSVVRNWNMDTGYRIEVDMNEAGQPRITWRHRWCQE